MPLMDFTLRRRRDRKVTRPVHFRRNRLCFQAARWMIRWSRWLFFVISPGAKYVTKSWRKEVVNTIFSVCSQNQHKIQGYPRRVSHQDRKRKAGCATSPCGRTGTYFAWALGCFGQRQTKDKGQMQIERRFTKAGQSAYAEIEFRKAISEIKNPGWLDRVSSGGHRRARAVLARSRPTSWPRSISARPAFPHA